MGYARTGFGAIDRRLGALGYDDYSTPFAWWDPFSWFDTGSSPSGAAEIQSVPANAAAANQAAINAGIAAPYNVPAIQASANQQTAAYQSELPTIFSQPASSWSTLTWALLAGGALFLLLAVKK